MDYATFGSPEALQKQADDYQAAEAAGERRWTERQDGAAVVRSAAPNHVSVAAEQAAAKVPLFTAGMAKRAKEQRERGFLFLLTNTGDQPAHVLVRKLALGDRAVIGALPQFIQGKLLQALADAASNKDARTETGGIDVAQALSNLARREDLINVVCVAGFIQPRLILSEAQRTNEDDVLVTDIDFNDRARFYDLANGDDDEVKALTPFLGPAIDAAQPLAAG